MARPRESARTQSKAKNRCGLCGKTRRLTVTDCCGKWICDDEDKYVLFSFARNSCSRNHRRFTLCGYHHSEKHSGNWKECSECSKSFETEMYVWYGTNDYNFEKLPNPPSYRPTHCGECGVVINLGEDEYSRDGKAYFCAECCWKRIDEKAREQTRDS